MEKFCGKEVEGMNGFAGDGYSSEIPMWSMQVGFGRASERLEFELEL